MSGVPIFNKLTEEISDRVEAKLQPLVDSAEAATDEATATVANTRLGVGRGDFSARIAVILGTGATSILRDGQGQTIGFVMASGQTGAASAIEVGFYPPKDFAVKFAGCEIELEIAVKMNTGAATDRTLSANTVYTSYDDGTADAFTGSVVSAAVNATDTTIYTRRVKTKLTAAMDYISANFRVAGNATETTAYSTQLHSFSARCVSVPTGSAYTTQDVGVELAKILNEPSPAVADVFGSLIWTNTRNNGALVRYINGVVRGITIPVGQTGGNTNLLAGLALSTSWRSQMQGAALGYYFLVRHSATFDRALTLAVNVNPGPVAISPDNGRFVQLDATTRLYEFRALTEAKVLAGTETSLSPYMRLATTQPSAVSGADQFFEVIDAWFAIERSTRSFGRAEHARRIASLRQKANLLSPALIIPPDSSAVTIKPSGGDYTHPKLALDAITDARVDRRYKLEVWPGTYDAFAEWHTKDWIDVVGMGTREECIISFTNADSASASTIQNTSTLWLDSHSDLVNLTVRVTNGRYAIHRETNGVRPGIRNRIINCFVEHLGNPSGNNTWRSQFGVGAGNSPGEIYEDWGSVFRGPDGGFSYHPPNNGDYTDPTFVYLDNCTFQSTGVHWATGLVQPDLWVTPLRRGAGDQCYVRACTLDYLRYWDGQWNPADTATRRNAVAVILSGNTALSFRNDIASPILGHDYQPQVSGFGGTVTWTKTQPA